MYIILYFLISKFVEQKMAPIQTSHAFFHSFTMVNHMTSVLQKVMINHGALLRLMLMEFTWVDSGETVTATVMVKV